MSQSNYFLVNLSRSKRWPTYFWRLVDEEEASSVYQRTLSVCPNHILARLRLAEIYLRRGAIDDSIQILRTALEVDAEFDRSAGFARGSRTSGVSGRAFAALTDARVARG